MNWDDQTYTLLIETIGPLAGERTERHSVNDAELAYELFERAVFNLCAFQFDARVTLYSPDGFEEPAECLP